MGNGIVFRNTHFGCHGKIYERERERERVIVSAIKKKKKEQ